MLRNLLLLSLAILIITLGACSTGGDDGKVYPLRWVYASRSLQEDSHVEELREIIQTAGNHGLNGILLSGGFDRLDLQPAEYFTRLEEVKRIAADNDVEIIPIIFSAGYGGSVLAHDQNLGAGLPVNDALFVVKGNRALLQPDPAASIENGSFEKLADGRAAGFSKPERWGEVISQDTEVSKEGSSSLRFENFAGFPEESAQLGQVVDVAPYRSYRLSCWVKTEGLDDYGRFGSSRFRLEVLATEDGRRLQFLDPAIPTTSDWQKITVGFNSWGYDEVEISPRAIGGDSGRIWIDGLELEEVGLVNLLRRPGTPVTVRADNGDMVYEEGRDYARLEDPQLDYAWDHDGPPIAIPPGSRIRDGQKLRVSYYHGISVNRRQVSICMSEPAVFDIWQNQVALIEENLAPKRYFLSMDEVRSGGSCKACKDRGITMGEIFGSCITRQHEMIRAANPNADVFVWSDQLDPNHNAGNRSGPYYYLVDGSFEGSWNHIPKDMIIACWWHRMRDKSLAHFSGLGFKTLGASYYDADDLENPKDWLVSLDQTEGAVGIMYTTWLNKYALLAGFGDLVSQR